MCSWRKFPVILACCTLVYVSEQCDHGVCELFLLEEAKTRRCTSVVSGCWVNWWQNSMIPKLSDW